MICLARPFVTVYTFVCCFFISRFNLILAGSGWQFIRFEPISFVPPSARWDSTAFLFNSSIMPAESQTMIEPGNPSTHSCLLTLTKTALSNSRVLADNRVAARFQGLHLCELHRKRSPMMHDINQVIPDLCLIGSPGATKS